jgi:hypothetical protein
MLKKIEEIHQTRCIKSCKYLWQSTKQSKRELERATEKSREKLKEVRILGMNPYEYAAPSP